MSERRLLLFNLRTDVDDHILGFTTRWINALAPYYDAIDVITTHAGKLDVADHVTVYSVGRERGASRLQRLMNFYRHLLRLLLRHHYVACFAHMQPLFAVLSAPLLTLWRIPLTTWYTHRSITRQLRWATRLSRHIVTAVPTSFPLASHKVRAIGHGIDTVFFAPPAGQIVYTPLRIVYVARLTEIKRQHILLEACQTLPYEIVFVGDVPDGFGASYKQDLIMLASRLGMNDRVIFAGAQTPEQVRHWYTTASLAVNLSPIGLFDKAALEAMACAVPTLVCNSAFDALLGDAKGQLQAPNNDDPNAIKHLIEAFLAQPRAERQRIGQALRRRVQDAHSLPSLMVRLVAILETGELPV